MDKVWTKYGRDDAPICPILNVTQCRHVTQRRYEASNTALLNIYSRQGHLQLSWERGQKQKSL